jgi:hypothetical protein
VQWLNIPFALTEVIESMPRKLNLPDPFIAISVGLIIVEATLRSMSRLKARCHARDAGASLGMQIGNICFPRR